MNTMLESRLPARLWTDTDGAEDRADERVWITVERDEDGHNSFSLHTFDEDGHGSIITYQLDRESAIGLAARILREVALT